MTKGRSFAASTVDGYTQRASQISYHFIWQAISAGNRAFCGGRGRYRPSGDSGKTRDNCHRSRTGNRSVGDGSMKVACPTPGSWRAGLSERGCPLRFSPLLRDCPFRRQYSPRCRRDLAEPAESRRPRSYAWLAALRRKCSATLSDETHPLSSPELRPRSSSDISVLMAQNRS